MKMDENSWCVARVRIGAEENVRRRCQEQISSEMLKDCYVFHYEEKRHLHGEWVIKEKILFPGYVFLVTDAGKTKAAKLEQLERELSGITGFLGLLKTGGKVAVLTDEEVNLLQAFGGRRQRVELSEGVIEWSKIRVHSGPLVGKENYIRKIDRHKRRAVLEMPVCGKMQRVQVGLEIVSKA